MDGYETKLKISNAWRTFARCKPVLLSAVQVQPIETGFGKFSKQVDTGSIYAIINDGKSDQH
jgi:hypothetical protein